MKNVPIKRHWNGMTRQLTLFNVLLAAAVPGQFALAQSLGQTPRPENRGARVAELALPPEASALANLSVVLGCPTGTTMTLNVLPATAMEGFIEYGNAAADFPQKTETVIFPAGRPTEITLAGLQPDAQYFYWLRYRKQGDVAFNKRPVGHFHTARAPGSTFTFAVQGDSHPERPQQNNPRLFVRTLLNAASDRPDFYLTIGDDFSVDMLKAVNASTVAHRYLLQRPFLGLIGQSAPLFLVNGNHEQAAACNLNGTSNNVAVWAQTARNQYYSQPAPDGFYTGDAQSVECIGLLRDYYAWTWGDALFVVIDPYWHSAKPVDNVFGGGPKTRDLWTVTLGTEQYQWLKRTLEQSQAKFKFVFAHHVLGTGRGGVEESDLYEWGGRNKNGRWEFDRQRSGWELPIHQLMAQNGVTIFFQGHDHIFVRQERDGVTYQTLPEPADPAYTTYNNDAFKSGVKLPNSGYIRVTVAPYQVSVDYVRSWLRRDETAQHRNGEMACHYELAARQQQ